MNNHTPSSLSEFDPFQNRLCRDIRNDLSEHFMAAISSGELNGLERVAAQYRSRGLAQYMLEYIEDRLVRYRKIVDMLHARAINPDDTYRLARLMWNHELFFEFHECLEAKWLKATGTEKNTLQALIRAAGTYVHLKHGRTAGAQKMSAKAVASLTENKGAVPEFFDADVLIAKLRALDPEPPKF